MDEKIRIHPGAVEWREVEGEIVALDVARSEYITVNESGTILWRALKDGATRADLVHALVREFGLGEQQAAADVDAFVASLSERGMLSG